MEKACSDLLSQSMILEAILNDYSKFEMGRALQKSSPMKQPNDTIYNLDEQGVGKKGENSFIITNKRLLLLPFKYGHR